MNNRPTPETDAAASPHIGFYSCATVTANFARRLEIERDEAIKERDKIQTELEMWRDGNILHEVHRNELEKVEQERNEAREEAHSFRSFYYAKTGINKGGCAFPWEEKLNE